MRCFANGPCDGLSVVQNTGHNWPPVDWSPDGRIVLRHRLDSKTTTGAKSSLCTVGSTDSSDCVGWSADSRIEARAATRSVSR